MSQLREHWDETSAKVIGRRNQLEEITVSNREYEAKRRETEAWLSRMEAWQNKDHAFLAEIARNKHKLDELNALTSRLIASNPKEDAASLKRITESANHRFASLNSKNLVGAPDVGKWSVDVDRFRARVAELDAKLANVEGNSRLNQEDESKLKHIKQAAVSTIILPYTECNMYKRKNDMGKVHGLKFACAET